MLCKIFSVWFFAWKGFLSIDRKLENKESTQLKRLEHSSSAPLQPYTYKLNVDWRTAIAR